MKEIFKIYSVDAGEVGRISASVNEPHSHDFEEIIIGVEGQLEHFIDFRTTIFDTPFISFVTKGKVHRANPLLKNGKCFFWVIRFKSEFIPQTIFQLYSYYHDNANLVLDADLCFKRIVTVCELMHAETVQPSPDYSIVRNLLSTLFSMIESEKNRQYPRESLSLKVQSITFKNFLMLLEENFRRSETVEFYSKKLFMSSRNLNLICQTILHQSVSEIVETRKLIEAKNLLAITDKSISEIGFELGYVEKPYFTSVFKKKSGCTPTAFRQEMRKLIS